MSWDEDVPKPKPAIVLGEDLQRCSLAELAERIEALKAELARVDAEVAAKRTHAQAAAALFDDQN